MGIYTNGVLYFSFAFKLDNITSSTSSETVAAFAIGTTTTYSPKINIMGFDPSLTSYHDRRFTRVAGPIARTEPSRPIRWAIC